MKPERLLLAVFSVVMVWLALANWDLQQARQREKQAHMEFRAGVAAGQEGLLAATLTRVAEAEADLELLNAQLEAGRAEARKNGLVWWE